MLGLAVAGCVEGAPPGAPAATPGGPGEGPLVVARRALTAPASWVNLWGSWPMARFDHAMTYDPDRHLTVVFGGRPNGADLFADTWEWDGARAQWVQRTPPLETDSPAPRAGHAMVYDAARQKMFLFGGWQPATGLFTPDQWEWDTGTKRWEARPVSGMQPSPRYGHAMVYDSDRHRVVLFGGFGGPGTAKSRLADLWEWDGATWVDKPPPGTRPSARWNALMVYDASRQTIVLHGGNTGTGTPPAGTYVDETWEWNGAAWSPRTPVVPTVTSVNTGYQRLIYDAARGKVIYYLDYQNMWEWNPDATAPSWNKLTTTKADTLFPPYGTPGIVYDVVRARVVIFGGIFQRTRDVWEWNPADGSWENRSVPIDGPAPRTDPLIALDSQRDALMVFGGFRGSDTSPYKQDIWKWPGAALDWVNLTSTGGTKPDVRAAGAMIYDTVLDRLVIFGGYGASNGIFLNDLWAWASAGASWGPLQPMGALPAARSHHWLFHDRGRNKLISYGGTGGIGSGATQVWELDLATLTWANRTPSSIPTEISGRIDHDITFDPDRGKLVLIGGATAGIFDAAVWEWDTTDHTWAARIPTTPTVPPPRAQHAIAYDLDRRVVIVVGGRTMGNVQLDDSWEWDGGRALWSETTPPTMRPLARVGHRLFYDEKRGTTWLYGGSAGADLTYGNREIWEYNPNRALRADGAPCSLSAAAACASGFCVDGVCCHLSACPGTCRACNVPGLEGACADVLPGGADDGCKPDQACGADHQCKSRSGQACGSFTDCATGHCADGVCCDSDCNQACRACNLSGRRGVCTNLPSGVEDPVGAPACVSDPGQGRACDGNGSCVDAKKALGQPCTASGQCTSTFCIDGVCCNNACAGTCQACNLAAAPGTCTPLPTGQQDQSATTTCVGAMQYCRASACAQDKKPNGALCGIGTDCGSGFCADGVCCDSACTGTCQACNLAGQVGGCAPIAAGAPDNSAAITCPPPQYCDGAGACASGLRGNGLRCTTGTDCGSGFCADGVCCNVACTDTCRACNLGPLAGTCSLLTPGAIDANPTGACAAPSSCAAGGACATGRKSNGAVCTADRECGSNNCIDGVCCESACAGKCRSCNNPTGTCTNARDGDDPRTDCSGDGACGGTCNGRGACRYPASGLKCRDAGCQSDGYIGTAGFCDGAGRCQFGTTTDCHGFVCFSDNGVDACRTDCATDPHCVARSYCDTAQCPPDLDNGERCDRDGQCKSGVCADGYCCDQHCGQCGSCNLPGKEGICDFTPAGTDPAHECIDSASDPSGRCGGVCNGRGACEFPGAGTTCGTCKACDGSGKCSLAPEDDQTCGDIDCDGLDTTCRDYHDLRIRRCAALGSCKTANALATCTDVTELCGPDAGPATDAGAPPDAAADRGAGGDTPGATDAGGTDAAAKPGGGGGCGCAIADRRDAGPYPPLALCLTVAFGLACARRRRRQNGSRLSPCGSTFDWGSGSADRPARARRGFG